MYKTLKKNWDNAKFILLSGFIVIFLLLLTVVYKSDEKITEISENNKSSYDVSDLNIIFGEFYTIIYQKLVTEIANFCYYF